MRLLTLIICLMLLAPFTQAQNSGGTSEQKHLIYFTDKADSPFSLQQPELYLSAKALERRKRQGIALTPRDFPVNPAYVTALKEREANVVYTSRWFNAAVVQCSPEKLAELQSLPFVRSSQNLNRIASPATGKKGTQANDSMRLAKNPSMRPTMAPPFINPICWAYPKCMPPVTKEKASLLPFSMPVFRA
jgi:serine protease AprX